MDLIELSLINKLKLVERANSVGSRKESPAEHTWSALILADYFIEKYKIQVNKQRVFERLNQNLHSFIRKTAVAIA